MKPENVNPKNFKVEKIIYNAGGFSVAKGEWVDDETKRFAMRWNGEGDEKGYPSVFDNPMWFQLPEGDIKGILKAIIENSGLEAL